MYKIVAMNVQCISAFDETPNHLFAFLDQSAIERIKTLSKVVLDNDLACCEFPFFEVEYCNSASLESFLNSQSKSVAELNYDDLLDFNDSECQTTEHVIEISFGKFRFKCIPKHFEDDGLCQTKFISIDELDKTELYTDINLVK